MQNCTFKTMHTKDTKPGLSRPFPISGKSASHRPTISQQCRANPYTKSSKSSARHLKRLASRLLLHIENPWLGQLLGSSKNGTCRTAT
jgi:hypothetical protein